MAEGVRAFGPPAEWTMMLYTGTVGADLSFSTKDLRNVVGDLGRVNDPCRFVCQINHKSFSERVLVCWNDKGDPEVETLAILPPIKTTSPKEVTAFVDWATATFPSRYTALVLKGHGGAADPPRNEDPREAMPEKGQAPVRPFEVLASSTGQRFLSNPQIREAVEETQLGRVDIYGFDACSVSSVEIAFELRNVASYMVASEVLLPQGTWPYAEAIRSMTSRAHSGPRTVTEDVAKEAKPSSSSKDPAPPLVAIDLAWMDTLGTSLGKLSIHLAHHVHKVAHLPVKEVPPDDVDVGALLAQLATLDLGKDVRAAVNECEDAFKRARFAGAGGLSILLPKKDTTRLITYGSLAFAQKERWTELVATYAQHASHGGGGQSPRPPASKQLA